jgi:2-methylisocitrate lyase-like PEP mutase family enzyme
LNGAILSAAMFEGGDTPWLTPAVLGEMGFRHVSFPTSLIFRLVETMSDTLAKLRAHQAGTAALQPMSATAPARQRLDEAVELAKWRSLDKLQQGK